MINIFSYNALSLLFYLEIFVSRTKTTKELVSTDAGLSISNISFTCTS